MKKMYFLLLWIGVLFADFANGQVIVSNTITGSNISSEFGYTDNQFADPNAYVNGIELGGGTSLLFAIDDNRYTASNWNPDPGINIDDYYFEFSISAASDFLLKFTNFTYSANKSIDGPQTFALRSSADDFGSNIGTFIVDNNTHTINLAAGAYQNITDIIFRVYGWNATDPAGTFSINDFAFNGTVNTTLILTTGTFSPASYTLGSCTSTASGSVNYSSPASFGGNTFTVELSDNTGSFGSPVVIGSALSDNASGNILYTIPAGTPTGTYKIRVVSNSPAITGSSSASFNITGASCGSLATHYFRSRTGLGNWATPSNWESAAAAGGPWITATLSPGISAANVLIQSGHTMSITTSVVINRTVVAGTLQLLTGGSDAGFMTLADGAGDELTINNNGTLQVVSIGVNYTAAVAYNTSGNINVLTGGKISIGDGASTHTGNSYHTFGLEPNNRVYWRDGSILEFNTTSSQAPGFSGTTYFPNATVSEIPILRISKSFFLGTTLGAASFTTVNGKLEVNADITFKSSGLKTFRNGIYGTDTLTLDNTATRISTPVLGGSLSIGLNTNLSFESSFTIPTASNVKLFSAITRTITLVPAASSIAINGIFDIAKMSISSTGSVTVSSSGYIKTANAFGLKAAGATFTGATLFFSAGSTIEYNSSNGGTQVIHGNAVPAYSNVIISGNGTKTLVGDNPVSGSITINGPGVGSLIFNANSNVFGSPTASLTMTGLSTFRTGGGGTKPDAGGVYTLSPTTTIEFQGIAATIIRLGAPINYASVVVNGTDVSHTNAATGLHFQNGGAFTVQNGARFKLLSTAGFSGSVTTAISNINNPIVTLVDGSTIEYNGTAQTISTVSTVPYINFELSGSGVKTPPLNATLNVKGNFTLSGSCSFAHNNGTILFNGPVPQVLTSSATTLSFYNVILPNPNVLTVKNNIRINKSLSLTSGGSYGKLALEAGNITLGSDANNTAYVDSIMVNNSISYLSTGRFIVERYIATGTINPSDHGKAWEFLATPVISNRSVNAEWQEGNTSGSSLLNLGYGAVMSSEKAGATGRGYDAITPLGPTIKKYDPATHNWLSIDDGVTNTNAVPLYNKKGYMFLIRGDRSVQLYNQAAKPTVLRTMGKLFAPGDDSAAITTVLPGKYESIGNPFASAIDFNKVERSGDVENKFYVWDPRLNGAYGLGGYHTIMWNGTSYTVTPPGGSYVSNSSIESGQAFLVKSTATGGTVRFTELCKVNSNNLVTKGPPITAQPQILQADLYTSDNEPALLDGALSQFDTQYHNSINGTDDAEKLKNPGENLGIMRNNTLLAVEGRSAVETYDTIFYNLSQLRQLTYRLQFTPQAFEAALEAYIVDNFLHTKTVLNLQNLSVYSFTITSDVASKAADRFYVVFNRVDAPMAFTYVNAGRERDHVVINWRVKNEQEVNKYVVESSSDGIIYSATTVSELAINTGGNSHYSAIDNYQLPLAVFYRIRAYMRNGDLITSDSIKVAEERSFVPSSITIYPNPVTGKLLNLQFTQPVHGSYDVVLFNSLGQSVYHSSLTIMQSGTRSFPLGNIPAGIYQLRIVIPGNKQQVLQIAIR